MEDVITVKDVTKKFRIYYDKGNTLKEKILFKNRNHYEDRLVLKDINLNIKSGETVGLIGENGSGKSTLLKLLTKIIYPDSGTIEIKGKVSSLLELGAGFHPDMTGRENIYMNASIFGLTKHEIDERLDDIISFSELEKFIDNPVRTYSSGMYMRLAFSVAINVEADILLIDEILAVGDANFQAKCYNKMQELKHMGITIVIVSHDLNSIERFADKVAWINKGQIREIGNPHDVVAKYLDNVMNKNQKINFDVSVINNTKNQSNKINKVNQENRTGNKFIEIVSIKLIDLKTNKERYTFETGNSIKVIVNYKRNNKNLQNSVFGIGLFRNDELCCYGTNTYIDNMSKLNLKDNGVVEVVLNNIQLLEGKYSIDIAFHDEYGVPYDYIRKAIKFNIYSKIKDTGIFRINHTFSIS